MTLSQLITEFKNHFDNLNQSLISEISRLYPDLPESALDRLKKVSEYNVPHGKLNRGLMVIEAFYEFRSWNLTQEDKKNAFCVGWCIEWLQACFLVADDVMDSSLTRRGQPCWFRQPDVGLMAVNDALILRSSVNLLLKKKFVEDTPEMYYKLSELFREVEFATEMGQMLDMTGNDHQQNVSDLIHMQRYQLITKYKTSLYSFYLPFACAYLLANQNSGCALSEIKTEKDILMDIGHLFQVQDDVLDVYGNPQTTGKIGTDIEEGKCTWLLCKCLSLPKLIESDRLLLLGSRDSKVVKDIYQKHNLLGHFEAFESEIKKRIETSIAGLSRDSSSRILQGFLNKIIKRIK